MSNRLQLAAIRDRCDNNISTMSMLLSIEGLKAEGARAPIRADCRRLVSSDPVRPVETRRPPAHSSPARDRSGSQSDDGHGRFQISRPRADGRAGEIGRGTFVVGTRGIRARLLFRFVIVIRGRAPPAESQEPVAQTGAGQPDGEAAIEFSASDQLQLRRTGCLLTASEAHQAALAGRLRRRQQLRPAVQHRRADRGIDGGFAGAPERGWHS